MMMPPPDGIDLLNYVRADPELFHVPVVMMSSNEHRGTVYECVKAGVDDFITKVRAAQAMPRVCRSLVADARVPNHRTLDNRCIDHQDQSWGLPRAMANDG